MSNKNPTLIEIGRRIKIYRKKIRMSQENLAEECELDRSYLGSVERGERNVTILTLERIIKVLGVTYKEFFE